VARLPTLHLKPQTYSSRPVTSKQETVKTAKYASKGRNTSTSIPPLQSNHTNIEISDVLDTLPIVASVELTRRLLTAVPTLPSGATRSRVVLKIVVLFVAEYGSMT
jgi:hypothetical protein